MLTEAHGAPFPSTYTPLKSLCLEGSISVSSLTEVEPKAENWNKIVTEISLPRNICPNKSSSVVVIEKISHAAS